MDLWQLQIFCRVIEKKSFSKAGRSIHLSQPTVSSHIKDLEDHFSCRLIDRLAKEAVPTEEGKLLYGYARRMLALKAETESALAEFQGIIRGRLKIGGSTIPGGYLLPRILGDFYQKHPGVSVSLSIGDTADIVEKIGDGHLELGIVGARTHNRNTLQEPFITDEMRLIVPADHPFAARKQIDFEQLKGEPFIARESGSGTLKSVQKILEHKGFGLGDLNIVAEMGNTVAVIQGIKGRVGVSIISAIAVGEELGSGSLKAIKIKGFNLKRHLFLVRHRHRTPSPLHRAFVAFIRDAFSMDFAEHPEAG